MAEQQKITQVMDYGRLISLEELMRYTSLGRSSAMKVVEGACAAVRIGKRVVYDRKKIDQWIDEQPHESK